LEKNGVLWALQVLNQDGYFESEIQVLLHQRKQLGENLPKAFLGGDDVKGLLKGEKIGNCLQEAYFLQLEGQLSNREMALNWLQQVLPKYKGT
jgi:tRNA nucleotidyltransferase (CCA-adding enzyme)